MPKCKNCGSEVVVKNGFKRGRQRYLCKKCGYNFVEGDARKNRIPAPKKNLSILLASTGKVSFNMIGKIIDVSTTTIYRIISRFGKSLPNVPVPDNIAEIEIDEMWHFVGNKNNKVWIIKAIDRATGKILAWEQGGRDAATVQKLYEKLKHLDKCIFYTDAWEAFAKVLPSERHKVGKQYTTSIEQNNSNTRHFIARFTRRTKVVSKTVEMVNIMMKLVQHVAEGPWFKTLQKGVLPSLSTQ